MNVEIYLWYLTYSFVCDILTIFSPFAKNNVYRLLCLHIYMTYMIITSLQLTLHFTFELSLMYVQVSPIICNWRFRPCLIWVHAENSSVKVRSLNWDLCTGDNDCANQFELVSEYTLDLFNETCYNSQVRSAPFCWSGQLSSLLEHLGISGGLH